MTMINNENVKKITPLYTYQGPMLEVNGAKYPTAYCQMRVEFNHGARPIETQRLYVCAQFAVDNIFKTANDGTLKYAPRNKTSAEYDEYIQAYVPDYLFIPRLNIEGLQRFIIENKLFDN